MRGPRLFVFGGLIRVHRQTSSLQHAHPVLILISAPAAHCRLFVMRLLAAICLSAELGRRCTGQRSRPRLVWRCYRCASRSCCGRRQAIVPADLFLANSWDVRSFSKTLQWDKHQRINELERFRGHTCSAAARVLNVTTTSPFSSVSSASTGPLASYQSRTPCTLSLPTSLMSNFLGRLSSFMLERMEPPMEPPRGAPR